MHLGQPVAQRVHDQLQGHRVADVERVAAAGRVEVRARVAGVQPVVGGVVQAPVAQRRPELVALRSVVEHDVDQHLEPGPVQGVDHGLELGDLTAGPPRPHLGRVGLVRREVPDRVVAPVVGQPALHQERLRHALVHRQQLDGGHSEVEQMADGRLVTEPGVGALQLGRYAGVPHGEALDVHLVDDRVRVRTPGPGGVVPTERLVHDQAAWHMPGRVQRARRSGVAAGRVPEHLGPEAHSPAERPGVRVEQQLGRVAAQPRARVVTAAGAVPIGLPEAGARHEAVPHAGVVVQQRDLGLGAVAVEQAQEHGVGRGGLHGEVRPHRRARSRPGGTGCPVAPPALGRAARRWGQRCGCAVAAGAVTAVITGPPG